VVSHHDDLELLVFLSEGDGAFATPASYQLSSRMATPHSHNLVLADVNRDGHLDVVQAQSEQNVILVLLGNGAGGFSEAPGPPLETGQHPYTVIVADFDEDAVIDLASPNALGGDLTVGLGQGTGSFLSAPGEPTHLGGQPLGLAAGDVNADGHVDLVVNFDDSGRLGLWEGDGSGSFRRSPFLKGPGRCYGQTVADLDGDGVADVIAPCIDAGAVAVWFGRAGGPLRSKPAIFRTPGTDSQVLTTTDLDGDGLPDVVTAGWDRPTVSVLLGRSSE